MLSRVQHSILCINISIARSVFMHEIGMCTYFSFPWIKQLYRACSCLCINHSIARTCFSTWNYIVCTYVSCLCIKSFITCTRVFYAQTKNCNLYIFRRSGTGFVKYVLLQYICHLRCTWTSPMAVSIVFKIMKSVAASPLNISQHPPARPHLTSTQIIEIIVIIAT